MGTESFKKPGWPGMIIAMKGLPCTGKTLVAKHIGDWTERPVLHIDDFVGDLDNNNNNIADEESWEEAERLQLSVLQQAFTTLCRVGNSQARSQLGSVVIKSRLSSPFELNRLISRLVVDHKDYARTLLIVECQVRNKHRWQNSFNEKDYEKTWYRPRRWNDIEKARDDHSDPQSLADWDLHLDELVTYHRVVPLVRRLVVDPYYDLDLPKSMERSINPILAHAINHLLKAEPEELNYQNPYVVEFDEYRRSRANEILNDLTSSTRSKDICADKGCLFKYREELQVDEDDGEGSCCGVCEQKLVSGKPGYICHYCILTLHKSCAELIHIFTPRSITDRYRSLYNYIGWDLPASKEKHACNSHLQEEFRGECESCRFQTALKGHILPAVVNHEHHPHPLSLRLDSKEFICKACGVGDYSSSYVCRICEWYYHIQCVNMPGEWKHLHGGHDHVLQRKYSHDDKDKEDYWCDVCFQHLDPYYWFYSCQSCPYYAAHLYCVGLYSLELWAYGVVETPRKPQRYTFGNFVYYSS